MSRSVNEHSDPAANLVELVPAFERAYEQWIQSLMASDCDSTPARMGLLDVLHCKGPQIMSDLGNVLGVMARQVTNLVDALEAERLVRRVPHPTDRRATVIEITAPGAETAEKFWQPFHEKIAGLYRELPEKDQRELQRILSALLEALRRKS
jgi:DNA-binding MarR family transcriptional regulator